MDGGTYYLPLDLTKTHNARLETYEDASIVIPLTEVRFVTKYFPFLVSAGSAKSQLTIKYADTVTPTNNYVRSAHDGPLESKL